MDNNNQYTPEPINSTNVTPPETQPLAAPVATEPAVSPVAVVPPVEPPKSPKRPRHTLGFILLLLVMVVLAGLGGLLAGKKLAPTTTNAVVAPKPVVASLALPVDATEISKCAAGRGALYAEPKDIPLGPVYSVWQGKVIGIEFMVGKDALLTQNTSYLNLPLHNQKYDHVNIGLLSQGHAGFPDPHYHVDVMMVPKSVTDQITCKV